MEQAGVDGHALATDQTFGDATRDSRLKQVAQKFAVAKTPVPVLGKRRVIRDWIREIEAAEIG